MERLPDRVQEAHREQTAGVSTMQIDGGQVHQKHCSNRGTIMQVYSVAGSQAFTRKLATLRVALETEIPQILP